MDRYICYLIVISIVISSAVIHHASSFAIGDSSEKTQPLEYPVDELEDPGIQEEAPEKGGFLGLDKFKETFSSFFGANSDGSMPNDENRCADSSPQSDDIMRKKRDEFTDSVKEQFDKWNNLIDSATNSPTDETDYSEILPEIFGGLSNEDNKMEISQ